MQVPPGTTLKTIDNGDIQMRVAEAGQGPAVLLLHGWPELWYSWRHQLTALADAGYRVIAPDMPGYGGTDALPAIEDYNIITISRYLIGLLDQLGESQVHLIGHDWGAAIAWYTAQLYPERFRSLVAMSVPFRKHAPAPPMSILKQRYGDRFFYQLYFQKPGVAEAEFDNDPRGILSRLYCSFDTPREAKTITDKDYRAGGWIGRLGEPTQLPGWMSEADLNYYVEEFTRRGFAGGINYYRNIDRNWELLAPQADTPIAMPSLFLAGDKDMVIGGADEKRLREMMEPQVSDLRKVILLPGIGHWVQQEAPEDTNRIVLDFLASLN